MNRVVVAAMMASMGVAMGLSMPACRNRSVPKVPVAKADRMVTGEWTVVDLYGKGVSISSVPWMRIEEGGAVSGGAGVNQFSSKVDADGLTRGEFRAGPVIATRMAGPPDAMKVEADFVKALGETKTYTARGDGLELWNEAGHIVASFKRKQ